MGCWLFLALIQLGRSKDGLAPRAEVSGDDVWRAQQLHIHFDDSSLYSGADDCLVLEGSCHALCDIKDVSVIDSELRYRRSWTTFPTRRPHRRFQLCGLAISDPCLSRRGRQTTSSAGGNISNGCGLLGFFAARALALESGRIARNSQGPW